VRPDEALAPYLYKDGACFEARAESGFEPKRQGERSWVVIERAADSCGKDDKNAEEWTVLPRFARAAAYLDAKDPATARMLPGRRVLIKGRLRPGRPGRNPGDFSESSFLEGRGAAYVFSGRVEAVRSREGFLSLPAAAAARVHRSIHSYLGRSFPQETAGVLEGLLLGYKGALASSTNRTVQDAGVMHLLVPSGAKVAVLLCWVLWLCGEAGLSRSARWLLAAGSGGFYVLVMGAQAPYVRAYLCFTAWAAASFLERESGALQYVALSAAAVLCWEPRELFTAGFQMTYAAVLGFHLCSHLLRLPRCWPRLARICARAVLASAVVQAALWPAFAAYFGRGSLAAVAANPILLPASGPWMACGFLAWGADACGWEICSRAFAWAAKAGADGFLSCCRFFASRPNAAVDLAPMAWKAVAAYYSGLLAAASLPRWKLSALWACMALGFWTAGRLEQGPWGFGMIVLSQAGGRAALLRSPDGSAALLDARIRPSILRSVLRSESLSRVDTTLLRAGAGLGPKPGKLLPLLGTLRVLRPGESFLRAGVSVRSIPVEGGGFPTLVIRFKDLVMESSEDWLRGRVSSVREEESERMPAQAPAHAITHVATWDFCIMISPSGFPSSRCEAGQILSLRRDGAVRILSDGAHVRLEKSQ
jgi:ComEC/Rec2-related protein